MKEVAEEDLDFPVGNHSFDPNDPLHFGTKARSDALYKADNRRRIHHLRFDAAQRGEDNQDSIVNIDAQGSNIDSTCSSTARDDVTVRGGSGSNDEILGEALGAVNL
jgi:hypothetical protein